MSEPVVFRDLAWFRREVKNKRDQRDAMLESAAKLDREVTALVAELRAVADELEPPTQDVAEAWDGGATEPRTTIAEDMDRWATGVQPMDLTPLDPPLTDGQSAEFTAALEGGRLTLRPTGRVWPAACEQCGARNGQPCQAVTE